MDGDATADAFDSMGTVTAAVARFELNVSALDDDSTDSNTSLDHEEVWFTGPQFGTCWVETLGLGRVVQVASRVGKRLLWDDQIFTTVCVHCSVPQNRRLHLRQLRQHQYALHAGDRPPVIAGAHDATSLFTTSAAALLQRVCRDNPRGRWRENPRWRCTRASSATSTMIRTRVALAAWRTTHMWV